MSHVPPSLTGKEFEVAILAAAQRLEKAGVMTLGRYGVQGVTFGGETRLVPSLPDFEGILAGGGRQIIIEAKATLGASFPLQDDKFRERQYRHLARRAEFGALAYIFIHWGERNLKTKRDPGMTVAVPVHPWDEIWQDYEAGIRRSISRAESLDHGTVIPWAVPKGCRKPLPDLTAIIPATAKP